MKEHQDKSVDQCNTLNRRPVVSFRVIRPPCPLLLYPPLRFASLYFASSLLVALISISIHAPDENPIIIELLSKPPSARPPDRPSGNLLMKGRARQGGNFHFSTHLTSPHLVKRTCPYSISLYCARSFVVLLRKFKVSSG